MKKLTLLAILATMAVPGAFGAADRIIYNGGVTVEERAEAPSEGTRLVFFVSSGNFLANIAVSVTDAAGNEVVNTTTEGPWLILDLDPGQYRVVATRSTGQIQSIAIDVGDASQEFGLSFPEES